MTSSEHFVIDITSAGVNRADLLQLAGHYKPPHGVTAVLGLECSGIISAVPQGIVPPSDYEVGQPVVALLSGGGQSASAVVPKHLILPKPTSWTLIEAGGLMEAACTVWSNLTAIAHLKAGETVLIQGGSGGIGTFAIQYARALGATVIATARTKERAQQCAELGAHHVLTYSDYANSPEELPKIVQDLSNGLGADVILDVLGGQYLASHIDALAPDGRLIIIGLQRGATGNLNLAKLLAKRATIHGTTLRARPEHQKAEIVSSVHQEIWPLLESGAIKPVLHQTLPLDQQEKAHALLASGEVFGKIVLLP